MDEMYGDLEAVAGFGTFEDLASRCAISSGVAHSGSGPRGSCPSSYVLTGVEVLALLVDAMSSVISSAACVTSTSDCTVIWKGDDDDWLPTCRSNSFIEFMAIVRERARLIGDMIVLIMAKVFGVARPITTPCKRSVIKRNKTKQSTGEEVGRLCELLSRTTRRLAPQITDLGFRSSMVNSR